MSEVEDIETMLEKELDEKILEMVIATKIDIAMVMEMMPKHFQDSVCRPPGYAIGSAFLRGLLVLTNQRLIFAAHPLKKRPDGLLSNINPDFHLAWNRFTLKTDENHPLEPVTSINLSSILGQRVVHDGIELIVNEPELMVVYFRDFIRYVVEAPMNGFPRIVSPHRFLEQLVNAKSSRESKIEK